MDYRRAAHRRALIAAAAVLGAAAVAVAVAQAVHPVKLPARSRPAALVATTLADGITLRHPSSWRYVRTQAQPGGPYSIAGYLTDQQPHSQCATHGDDMTCGGPVHRLSPGGVLIAVFDASLFHATGRPNTSFAGTPALVVQAGPNRDSCPQGTDVSRTLTAPLPHETATVIVSCVAGPNVTRNERAVRAMLATARRG